MAAGALALSVTLSAFFWRSRPLELVLFWQAVMLALALALTGLAWAYRRSRQLDEPRTWIRRLVLGAVALGAGWGYGGAVFFPGTDGEQAFIALMVAVVTAGALPVFSLLWRTYSLYAAAVILPFCIVLLLDGNDFQQLLAAAMPLLYIANVMTARELSLTFTSAQGSRTAYQRLSDDNARVQAELGEQLDTLLDAHRELRTAAHRLRLFSERAPIAVFEVDSNATILEMNPAAENLFGYAAPELIGRNYITMLLAADERERIETWWREFIIAGQPATLTIDRCLRRDGLEVACEWTLTPLSDEDTEATTIVLQGRDITQQRAAERVRTEFTSTLSHELRTPLTSILGSLQLMGSGALGEVPREAQEMVEVAERNGQRLLDLINEVLDIEKIESGRVALMPERTDLDDLAREAIRLNQGYADRFQVRLVMTAESSPLAVRGDRKRLMQVISNLLSNAAKFSPPQGVVEVAVAKLVGSVRVSVSDRGPGIPQDFRGRIFGRFAQAHSADSRIKGGTGLGLAISKRLIEMMEGRLAFEDRDGGGTVFYFEMPLLRFSGGEDEAPRVLITENDNVAGEYLAMVLEKGGYQVDIAPDAATTVALLSRWRYAAWLLARRLENDADGLSLIGSVANQPPTVVLSGISSDVLDPADQEGQRIVGWLAKSDSRARILEVVGQAVQSERAGLA